jgi:hypothetical protein
MSRGGIVGVLAAALAVSVTLVGCGSGGDGTEVGSSSPSSEAGADARGQGSTTTPTTVSTTVVTLSVEEAGARYLEIVQPYNEALEAVELAINGGLGVDAVRPLVSAVATTNATHIEQLRAEVWPEVVASAVDQLVTESELAQEAWLRAAEAPTLEAMIQEINASGEHDGSEPAAAIRLQLGLDAYDEDDYTP